MRTFQELERLVDEQARSGQSVPAFCAGRGLPENSFYAWRKRVRERRGKFVPVVVGDRIEIELDGGVRLKVAKHDLKAVLEALR